MNPSDCRLAPEACSAAIVASANAEFRKRILKWLGARSWTVEEAVGGAEALSLVEEGTFKALLLDRWLPDLDVPELVDIIKTRHPQVQVLVVGSEAEEHHLVERLFSRKDLPLDFPKVQAS
jgi:CheY-like chemotaxis protein